MTRRRGPYVIVNQYTGEAWTKLAKTPGTINKFHHVRREYKTLAAAEKYVKQSKDRMPVTHDMAEMTITPLVQFLVEHGE